MKKLLAVLTAAILCFGTACAAGETGENASPDTLRTAFEDAGFYVQNGTLYEFDTLRLASEGKLLTCFGNNAGSAYLILDLPPAPEQDAAAGNEERGWTGERATA